MPIMGTDRQAPPADGSHVMVVEDDRSLAAWLADYLNSHGYLASVATDGTDALVLIEEDEPDLILLDWNLPGLEGIEVCRRVRERSRVPILMLTARTEEGDEVTGLETGADDYLTKPVRGKVLLARVRALLRREGAGSEEDCLRRVGALAVDMRSRSARLGERTLELSSLEFDVLAALTARPGETLGREELVAGLRGIEYDGFDRSIDLCVSRLRRKIGDRGGSPSRIKTVRGKGYLLAPDAW